MNNIPAASIINTIEELTMKTNKIASAIAATTILMSIQSPVMAQKCMQIYYESQSNCEITGIYPWAAYANTEFFRLGIATMLGSIQVARESCPDIHMTVGPHPNGDAGCND